MKDPGKLKIEYIGYEKPENEDEVILEILGLELAISLAKERIALLKQGLKIAEMKGKSAAQEK